jgi:ribosomal protein S18 acetylase RimI-like enzyme
MHQVVYEVAPVDDFLRLRKITGLTPRPKDAAVKALPRSLYGVHIIINEIVIGMGRVVGDGALNFDIVDVAVAPEFQSRGYGRIIMENIMNFLDREAPLGSYITLMADVPELYAKFGFKLVGPESEGMYIVK